MMMMMMMMKTMTTTMMMMMMIMHELSETIVFHCPDVHDRSWISSGRPAQLFPKFTADGSYSVPKKGEPSLFQAAFRIFSVAY
jgi:hypothetical protein